MNDFKPYGELLLLLAAIITAFYKLTKWAGAKAGQFVRDVVLPPINDLTKSVDDLALRTREHTEILDTVTQFAQKQADINLNTAVELARIHGLLNNSE